jgi:GTPase
VKFLDEVLIQVTAGKGGNGCISFRREKFLPRGGPNGGNGGKGGDIYLQADSNLNTLVDFHGHHFHRAKHGQNGSGHHCAGQQGTDLLLKVPVGTEVFSTDTEEFIGDLTSADQTLLVAKGGRPGLGNACFKSSTRRAPRICTAGEEGESRNLRLSLKLLADVGLLGLPNAGKSTFTRAVSAATPKVAAYPFTTLQPQLGVVCLSAARSFTVADLPGLIASAAQGVGLGIRFLKHLARTRLLLHIVDASPDNQEKLIEDILTVQQELNQYSEALFNKPRWVVLNKLDLVPAESREAYCNKLKHRLSAHQYSPSFEISAIQREGTQLLCEKIMSFLESK